MTMGYTVPFLPFRVSSRSLAASSDPLTNEPKPSASLAPVCLTFSDIERRRAGVDASESDVEGSGDSRPAHPK
jgi:hypothetical protein